MLRMRGTISRTHACSAWLMFRRNTSAPALIICRSVAELFEAGPSVQIIFVLRTSVKIEVAPANARGFSKVRHDESCEKPMRTVHCEQMHQSSFDNMTRFWGDS